MRRFFMAKPPPSIFGSRISKTNVIFKLLDLEETHGLPLALG
jgi:hypothetical protein